MSASPARTFLFARFAQHGVTARAAASARRVAVRATPLARCRNDTFGQIGSLGGAPRVLTVQGGSRAFVSACVFRDGGRRQGFGLLSARRRLAGVRVVVNALGDVKEEEEPDLPAADTVSGARNLDSVSETQKATATHKATATPEDTSKKGSHQLITFFMFTKVPCYEKELEEHRAFIETNELELRGRIYLNGQGVNAQMSGKGTDGETYARWVEKRTHFNGMRISIYPIDAQAHPKLSLRYKPQLVQLEGGTAHLPLTDPEKRGTPMSPREWHERIGDVLAGKKDAPLLLDVRNGYEWDVGHFKGARRPVQESFRETVATNVDGVTGGNVSDGTTHANARETVGPLAGVDKNKPIMMYCTGGIRCDVYSTVLKQQGYENVFTLEGGAQAYFEQYGTREDRAWNDQLFVFDSRLAMTPGGLPASSSGAEAATLTCHCCHKKNASAPHRNCPNVDCNRLFLVCVGCVSSGGGFCCAECRKASHVRPSLLQPERYQKYAHYTDGEAVLRSERRGEGRKERRQRRRVRKKAEASEIRANDAASGVKPRNLLRAVRVLEKAAQDPTAFSRNEKGTGTLAARTRSIVAAAGLLEDTETTSPDLAYKSQREKLRKAAEAIANGNECGLDLVQLRAMAEDEFGHETGTNEQQEERKSEVC